MSVTKTTKIAYNKFITTKKSRRRNANNIPSEASQRNTCRIKNKNIVARN